LLNLAPDGHALIISVMHLIRHLKLALIGLALSLKSLLSLVIQQLRSAQLLLLQDKIMPMLPVKTILMEFLHGEEIWLQGTLAILFPSSQMPLNVHLDFNVFLKQLDTQCALVLDKMKLVQGPMTVNVILVLPVK